MPSRSKFSLAGTTTREAATATPPTVDDVRVQAAPAIPVAEKENTEVAARITPGFMQEDDRAFQLQVGVFLPEAQDVFRKRAFQAALREFCEDFIRARIMVKFDHLEVYILDDIRNREVFRLHEHPRVAPDLVEISGREKLLGGTSITAQYGVERFAVLCRYTRLLKLTSCLEELGEPSASRTVIDGKKELVECNFLLVQNTQ